MSNIRHTGSWGRRCRRYGECCRESSGKTREVQRRLRGVARVIPVEWLGTGRANAHCTIDTRTTSEAAIGSCEIGVDQTSVCSIDMLTVHVGVESATEAKFSSELDALKLRSHRQSSTKILTRHPPHCHLDSPSFRLSITRRVCFRIPRRHFAESGWNQPEQVETPRMSLEYLLVELFCRKDKRAGSGRGRSVSNRMT